jgi:hypothetical protein
MVWYNNTQINKLCISIHFNIFSKGERIMSNSACTVDKKKLIKGSVFITTSRGNNIRLSDKDVNHLPQEVCSCARDVTKETSGSLFVTIKPDESTRDNDFVVDLWEDKPENGKRSLCRLYANTTKKFVEVLESFGISSSNKIHDNIETINITLVLKT